MAACCRAFCYNSSKFAAPRLYMNSPQHCCVTKLRLPTCALSPPVTGRVSVLSISGRTHRMKITVWTNKAPCLHYLNSVLNFKSTLHLPIVRPGCLVLRLGRSLLDSATHTSAFQEIMLTRRIDAVICFLLAVDSRECCWHGVSRTPLQSWNTHLSGITRESLSRPTLGTLCREFRL